MILINPITSIIKDIKIIDILRVSLVSILWFIIIETINNNSPEIKIIKPKLLFFSITFTIQIKYITLKYNVYSYF